MKSAGWPVRAINYLMEHGADAVYRDRRQPTEARVRDLLSRMTLDEKLAQLGSVWGADLLEDTHFSPEKARALLRHGTGSTRLMSATTFRPRENAALFNSVQRYVLEHTRLGIPVLLHDESCAGATVRDATQFPQAIGLASTWDPELIGRIAVVIREQLLALGIRLALAPVLDVARDPRWGRVEETFGEDPYLSSRLGVAYVRGLQGASLCSGVAATAKHFLGYGVPEGGLNWAPCQLPRRELMERILPPFEAVIREANIACVMNGYHEIDGVPCAASRELLTDLLRGELGFDGLVVADYFSVWCLYVYHRIAKDEGEAAARSLEAGLDLELPRLHCYGEPLRMAVESGRVPMALVDRALGRVLRLKFELGLFEAPYVDGDPTPVFSRAEDRELCRTAAERSLVLLKNDGVLPLSPALRKIAVIGPNADSRRHQQGDYHYPAHVEMQFGAIYDGEPPPDLPSAPQGGMLPGAFQRDLDLRECLPETVTILEGIRARAGASAQVEYVRGCDFRDPSRTDFEAAVAAARAAQVAILVVGGRSGLLPGCTSGEGNDSALLTLPGAQLELIRRVAETGTPTVVVLVSGRATVLTDVDALANALLVAWIPGQEGGSAVARVLFGDVSPEGRLPLTLPRTVGQVPLYYNHKPSGARAQFYGDYCDSSMSPLYCFGHGLSYTRFEYADLSVTPRELRANGSFEVRLRVRNAGERAGAEVVQLYLGQSVASVTRPVQELRGFARVALAPGEAKQVKFTVDVNQLAFLGLDMQWLVEPGTIEVQVGASASDIRLREMTTIAGAPQMIERAALRPTAVSVE